MLLCTTGPNTPICIFSTSKVYLQFCTLQFTLPCYEFHSLARPWYQLCILRLDRVGVIVMMWCVEGDAEKSWPFRPALRLLQLCGQSLSCSDQGVISVKSHMSSPVAEPPEHALSVCNPPCTTHQENMLLVIQHETLTSWKQIVNILTYSIIRWEFAGFSKCPNLLS